MLTPDRLAEIAARVARGAALLDEQVPGWVYRIDLTKLDLASPCNCILGQHYADGGYNFAVNRLVGKHAGQDEIARYGFEVCSFEPQIDAYRALTAEWKRVILARRGEGR